MASYFLNLSSKFPAGVRVRTSKYPYMDICDVDLLACGCRHRYHHHHYLTIPRVEGRWELGNVVPKSFPPHVHSQLDKTMVLKRIKGSYVILYTMILCSTPRFMGLAI